jgi:flagellar biogenesis protein FliO
MYISPNALSVLILILALILLTLYIMRRRVRLGRRQGKF